MALSDPKNYAVTAKPEPTLAEVLASMRDMMQVLATAKSPGDVDAAQKQVDLMERLINKTIPENKTDPGISIYSRKADGTYYKPEDKPQLRCKTVVCGRELTGDTETPDEILLLNQLEPGEYRVTKADLSSIPFKVTSKTSDNGKLEEIAVWFPCTKEHKHNHMPLTSYIRQALGGSLPTVPEMMAELQKLREELARAKTGVMSAV
jgi:hypothetical protein